MKQSLSSPASRRRGALVALVALAAITLGACSERPNPTQPKIPDPSRRIICGADCDGDGGGGGGGGTPPPPPPPLPVSIAALSLNDITLAIEGVPGTYTATITNGGATLSGVVAQGYIVQGTARRGAGGTQVSCGAGTGVLPSGSCQVSFSVTAGNSGGGSGTLIPGIATFELEASIGSFKTTKTVGINLLPGAFTASVPTALSLTGALGQLSTTMSNPGPQAVPNVSFETTVIQGSARRSAGAMPIGCPETSGYLPVHAVCTTQIWLSVKNTNQGTGMLVAGPATVQVSALQGTRLLSTRSYPTTLVDARFTSVTASANSSRIDVGTEPFTATVSNAGPSLSNVSLSGYIRQGSVQRGSVSATVNCGNGPGVLRSGTCTITGTYFATNNVPGRFTLFPGPATLYLTLKDASANAIDSTSVGITLVARPKIVDVTTPAAVVIGTSPAPFTVTIDNPGGAISNATLTVRILQVGTTREASVGPLAVNCGNGPGTVPTGTCTVTGSFFASNAGVGTGVLVPGSATFQIQLSDPADGLLFSWGAPITLVAP